MKKATFIFLFMVFSTFAINAQVTVSLPDLSAPAGETVFVPVQISGYNNGLSMLNAYVAYDSSVVEYQGLVNFDANMPSGEWQYGTNGEQLGANWFANQPITNPPDEIVLFEIQFLYKGGDCYLLFSNSPFAVEVYDLAYSPYSITFENGSITGNGSDIYIDSTSISKTLVAGTTGESHMTISNIGTGILDYSIEVDYVTEKFDLSFLGKQNNELLEVIDKEIPEGISIKLSDSQIKPLPPTDDIVLRYDNGTKGGELGASGGGFFDVAVFFPDSVMLQYIGHQLENVDIYIDNPAESCELKIYQGGSPGAPGELIYTQPVTVSPYGWNNIVLSTPVPIDGQGLWISFLVENLSGRNPIAVDSGPNSYPGYSDNLTVNGVWTTLASFGYYHNLMITAHLSDDQILNWLTVSPKTGIINAGETETIDLLFNATQLEPGVYNANLEISSNSLSNNFIIVPVELTVTLCDISVTIDTSNYNGFAIDCAGNETGWIKLTIENGTPPYSIEWLTIETTIISDTNIVMIDSLPYGEYFYHLEDFNGCEANDTIYLHQPGMYLVEASTHYACQNNSNGSIFLQVFGGTPPYSFSWSNGATSQNLTNIPAGEYTVWIQDQNDCIFTETYSVDEFICLVGTPTPTCWGDCDGSIDLEVQLGVLPYEYIWIKTDDPYFHETTQDIDSLCAGEYCVTVTDDVGFQSSACFYVEEYGIPQLGFCFNGESINAYDEFVLCQNDWEGVSIDLCIASPGAAPYQIEYEIWLDGNFWHYDYGSYSQGENLFYYFPTSDLDPGTYEFQVLSITDNNGCEHPLDDYTFYFIINPEPEIEICVNEQWSPPGIPHEFCETENIDVSICNVIAGINPFEMCFDIYHDGDLFMDGCNWYFEGDQIIDQILEPGLYEFWFYSIMDGNGCLVNYPEEYNFSIFIQEQAEVYPGQDVTICEGESYFLENASATNYNQLMWLGGNGTFDDPTMLNTTYTPAVGELGGIEICIEVEPVAPCFIVIEDCINLFIQPNPEVDAGMDAIICQGDIYTLYGATASNYSSLMWYGGLGGFNNPGILNPIYTPDAMEAGSTVTLCIEAQAIDPCTVSVSDCMDLFIQPLPFVNPGQDVTICEGESYFLENASATNYYQLMWLGGNGTFDDPTMLNTTYTPAMGELGGIEICIEVEPVAPCFIVIEDCINLFIQPNPEVDAGEDATIFAGENFELVDATASNFSSLEWSGGEGYFSNQFMLHPVYFPVFAEYGTTIELCLTADPIQPCTISVIDCMLLTVLNPEAPTITSIYDIPNDQGGWVYIDFLKSVYDTDTLRGTESYTVQRYDEDKWVSVNYMLAYGQDEYTVEARTLTDSSSQDNGLTTFRILAGMDEGNWASQADSGYSMDNLAPFTPEDLKGFALAENTVQLNWSLPVDDDFQYFAIYRSKEDGLFIPYTTTISNQIEDELGIADYSYKVTAFDFNGNESESSEIVSTQNLNLKEGWSGISGYVLPDFAELENVFESVIDDLLILQNMDGIYWPGENVNTLGNWNTNSGYAVKMNNQFNLPLAGKMINEHILDLEAGWKVIPVLSECNVNVADLFNGTDVIIVKDVAGWNIYWPEFGINTLSVLEPGNAYFVLMNSVGEISFPECDGLKVVAPRALSGFQTLTELVTKTASSHTIAIPNSVMENLEIQNGSLIKAYDGSGECFGVGIWQDESTSITLFGDDPLTETKDGFDENEIITFRLWNPENDEEFLIEVSFDPSMPNPEKMFVNNGLSAIASIKVSTSGISDNHDELNIQIIPNPAKDEFMLSIASKISQAGMLKIFSLDGQEVAFETIENENTKIGIHHLESGIYILQIEMNGNTVNKKLLKY